MSATLEEYKDLLMGDTYVDLPRLRNLAQHGVPADIRSEVWKYLLEVSRPDRSEEVSYAKKLLDNYWEMAERSYRDPRVLRMVKGQLRQSTPQWQSVLDSKNREVVERVAACYIANCLQTQLPPNVALMLPPFVTVCTGQEVETYYCFHGLMCLYNTLMPPEEMGLRVARFVMLFKVIYPEVNAALEEEEVEPNEWVVSWLEILLCRELPVDNALRLWDSYFAADTPEDGLLLHPYVCLAVMENIQGTLIELSERSEMLSTLQHLPAMDMEHVITQAQSIRDEVRVRNLL
mmetsp:Transcript_39251/g.94599  ORF Transcript_39251/g.94599 Transcript_39251/m.94599 type:complete len:290 (+) Transcript_39251:53-922(+)